MIKNILFFVAGGAIALVVVALYLGQPVNEASDSASVPASFGAPTQVPVAVRQTEQAQRTTAPESRVVEVEATDGSIDQPVDESTQVYDEALVQFAESIQSTPELVLSLLEENLNSLAADPDRQDRFASDARSEETRLFQLESLVTNEAWRNAAPNQPTVVESVCYPAGCRLKLFFATTEGLVAVAGSSLDLRMLFVLRDYGFGAAEMQVDFAEQLSPDSPAEAVDVFLWPESDSRLQSVASRSLG